MGTGSERQEADFRAVSPLLGLHDPSGPKLGSVFGSFKAERDLNVKCRAETRKHVAV